ncbi:serine/threonine-protein kinase kinY-like [Oopsacas minuta]|uniref:Serine/threonine-protein kinase kinY-like n=1 Tax=Oopsacas minuta TaxID=111878 RepID=A0AAV7K7Z1_9METZ|nr:serine/threonine-protein kinase kinY-like [Oopsacas minuta]
MKGTVKEFKNLIEEEFNRFHSLLDRRQHALTTKLDEYINLQNQEKELNLIKFENSTEIDSIETPPPTQLSILQFIAEETPIKYVDKKPQFFEIKFQIQKGPVEKEIEQCGEILMEQLAELDTPPQTPQEENYPLPYNFPSPIIKQEVEERSNEFCSCNCEDVAPMPTQPKLNSWFDELKSTPQEQEMVQEKSHYDVIMDLMDSTLRKGDIWCLVSCSWFRAWRQYASNKLVSESPGPVDNLDLLNTNGILKKNLVQNVDYKLVPESAWRLLLEKFGSKSSVIRRWVVEYGSFRKGLRVEVYLLALNCQINNKEDKQNKVVQMSRLANFSNLETQLKQNVKFLNKAPLQFSYRNHVNEWKVLDDLKLSPQAMGMLDGQQIKVDVKRNNCKSRVRTSNGLDTSFSKKGKFV